MAKYLPLPKSLKEAPRTFISSLIEATEVVFKGDLFGEVNLPQNTSYTTTDGDYHWNSTEELKQYVTTLTSTTSVRSANAKLYQSLTKAPEYEETQTETQKYSEPTNTTALRSDQLQDLGEIAKEREKFQVQAKEEAIRKTKEFLDQQEKRVKNLKNIVENVERKKVYVKVNFQEGEKLNSEQENAIKTFEEQAKANPKKFAEDLSSEIERRISSQKPEGITAEEIKGRSNAAALDTTYSLINNHSPVVQTVALKTLTSNPEEFSVFSSNKDIQNELYDVSKFLTDQQIEQYKINREFISSSFGEAYATRVYGPKDISQFKANFSNEPAEGYQPFGPSDIYNQYSGYSGRNNLLLENFTDFSEKNIKSQLLSKSGTWIEKQIAGLPVDSTTARLYNSSLVQSSLKYFGLGTPVEWVGTNAFGRIAISTGYGPSLGWLGEVSGINFGVAGAGIGYAAAASAAAATTTSVATTGGIMAAEAFAGGVGAATAGAAAGTAVLPIIGTAAGAVAGAVAGSKIKNVLSKIKRWVKETDAGKLIVALPVAGLFGLMGGGIFGMVGGGLGTFLGLQLASSGVGAARASLANFGGGIISGISFLFTTALAGIGIPILVSLIAVPAVVALILFIINSGAYVVPKNSLSPEDQADNPYILVTKTPSNSRLNNSNTSQKVTYTVEIAALKDPLSNIKIVSSECDITTKSGRQLKCPAEAIPPLEEGLSISPTSPHTFSFSVEYGPNERDSLIYDSITVSADAGEESITTTGSASVCVGDCAIDCIVVSDIGGSWGGLRGNAEKAILQLGSKHPKFVARACKNNQKVNLCFSPSQITPGYYAWHRHTTDSKQCDVFFNNKGVGNVNDALFLITHELTHHIQKIDGKSVLEYDSSGGFNELSGKGFCTYKDTAGSKTEAMAEASGLFAAIPSWGKCVSNYRSQYPRNFNFARGFMQ